MRTVKFCSRSGLRQAYDGVEGASAFLQFFKIPFCRTSVTSKLLECVFCRQTIKCIYRRVLIFFQLLVQQRSAGGRSVFTALHGMQTRSCDEISLCPSVFPSVKRVNCDKTEEKSVQSFTPCERSFCLVL